MYRAGGQPHVPVALPLGNRLGTLCAGGWVDARVVLDKCRKADSHWNSIPKQCSPQQVATLTTLSWPTLNDSVSCYLPCRISLCWHFRGLYQLHLQGAWISLRWLLIQEVPSSEMSEYINYHYLYRTNWTVTLHSWKGKCSLMEMQACTFKIKITPAISNYLGI